MKGALFLHGFLTDEKDFGKLPRIVKGRYDKISRIIFPGHQKPNDFSKFTVDDTLNMAVKAFDQLKKTCDDVDVYGFSMGGAIATYLTKIREPSRLILLAPANKYLNVKVGIEQFKFQVRTINTALKPGEQRKERLKKAKIIFSTNLENDKRGLKLLTRQLIPNYNYHTLSTFMKLIKKCNLNLTEIKCPTLIMWGYLDQFVPIDSANFVKGICTNEKSKLVIFDDISHLMLISKNDKEVIKEVINFIQ